MLGYMFENRNSTLKSAIKIADCLGRSLRENVQLFSLDPESDKATFITESGFVVDGNYSLEKGKLSLKNIQVQNSDIFVDNDHFNTFVSSKIKTFVSNIHEADYANAGGSFDEILDLWDTRLRFNEVKKRLEEKAHAFSNTQEIINTPEIQKFLEIAPQIISWLHESKDQISSVLEIKNAVKLSNSVSKAFDIPKISVDKLNEDKEIVFNDKNSKSIYDIICRQELVAKELRESKQNFDVVWANNKNINALATLLYSGDKEKVSQVLSEALSDVPYLALATKKQLLETFVKTLQLENSPYVDFSEKDLKSFASIIFEMKKPVKSLLIKTINEKYGVNIQNLKEVPSFRGLVEAQIVIFESLSRLAPRSSIIKDVLGQVSKTLKEKSGVEAIDVNDILQAIFDKSGYTYLCEDYSITDKINLKDMFENDLSPSEIVSLIEAQVGEVSDKIDSLTDSKKAPSRKDEDADKGYPEKGIEGGTKEAKKEEKNRKNKKGNDDPDSPDEVQAQLSGEDDVTQYGEGKEDPSDKPEKKNMSKEDFFANLDALTTMLRGGESENKEGETKQQ